MKILSSIPNKPKSKNKLHTSFHYAVKGIVYAFYWERNMKIHGICTAAIVVVGLFLHISRMDWIALFLTIGLVIAIEMMNTATEALVDLVTEEYRHFAAVAKNVAAGAVLVTATLAIIIGLLIFLPYLI